MIKNIPSRLHCIWTIYVSFSKSYKSRNIYTSKEFAFGSTRYRYTLFEVFTNLELYIFTLNKHWEVNQAHLSTFYAIKTLSEQLSYNQICFVSVAVACHHSITACLVNFDKLSILSHEKRNSIQIINTLWNLPDQNHWQQNLPIHFQTSI